MNGLHLQQELHQTFMQLGESLGRFDLPGQLRGLEAIRRETEQTLQEVHAQRENRLRSYQTLGLCAGASLAILFL